MDSFGAQLFKLLLFVGAVVLVVGGILRWQFVDVVTVGNDAMGPTFFGGDTILVWRTNEFDHASILLCEHPQTPGTFVLGRMLARPGMNLETVRGQLRVNGQMVGYDLAGEFQFEDQRSHAQTGFSYGREVLGEVDHLFMVQPNRPLTIRPVRGATGFFLLSDNRAWNGADSRAFGVVSPASCHGVAFMRWSPGGRAPAALGHGYLDLLD
ncbi:MAG: signal peptidase I [Deltaproteobacteria bacterium]|jgi:signal peptidase I